MKRLDYWLIFYLGSLALFPGLAFIAQVWGAFELLPVILLVALPTVWCVALGWHFRSVFRAIDRRNEQLWYERVRRMRKVFSDYEPGTVLPEDREQHHDDRRPRA